MYSDNEIKTIKTKIINDLAKGKSLLQIIRKGRKPKAKIKIPVRQTIYNWLNPNHEDFDAIFLDNYTQAREDSADLDAEKIEQIVEDVRNDKLRPDQARVMGDLLKWTAGRKKPKKYGDKLDVTTGGKELTQQVAVFQMPDNNRDKLHNTDGKED